MARKKFSLFDTVFGIGKAVYTENKRQKQAQAKAERDRLKAFAKSEKERVKLQEYYKLQDLLKRGYVFVTQKQLEKYRRVMDGEVFTSYLLADSPSSKIPVLQSDLDRFEREYQEQRVYEKKLKQCAALNNRGIAFEKEGKVKSAINCYEKNIESDYPARHSYDRLLVLYRKAKDIDNEIRVCELSTIIFPDDEKYKDRLEKAKKLNSK